MKTSLLYFFVKIILTLTWKSFTEDFNGRRHFLFTDPFIFLFLGSSFKALPWKATQVEVHQYITK